MTPVKLNVRKDGEKTIEINRAIIASGAPEESIIKRFIMWKQIEIALAPKRRGCHLVTDEIMRQLPELPKIGLTNIFIKHTSAALTINENADPDVQIDLAAILDRLVK